MGDLPTLQRALRVLAEQPDLPSGFFDVNLFRVARKVSVPVIKVRMKYEINWRAHVGVHNSEHRTRQFDDGTSIQFEDSWTNWNDWSGSKEGYMNLLPIYAGNSEPGYVILAAEDFEEFSKLGQAQRAGFRESEKFLHPNSDTALLQRVNSALDGEIPRLVSQEIEGRLSRSKSVASESYNHSRKIDHVESTRVPVSIFETTYRGKEYSFAVSGINRTFVSFEKLPRISLISKYWAWGVHIPFWIPDLFSWKAWLTTFFFAFFWRTLQPRWAKRKALVNIDGAKNLSNGEVSAGDRSGRNSQNSSRKLQSQVENQRSEKKRKNKNGQGFPHLDRRRGYDD